MPSISQILEHSFNRDQDRYYRVATLEGHGGPVNTFSFNASGSLLASGGDDEKVKIWDMNMLSHSQTLFDPSSQWGQITVVKFVQLDSNAVGLEYLCFGTGRGQFSVYRRSRKGTEFVECLNSRIFSPGDSVEYFAFDQYFQRVAVSSHYGKVKMFHFEKGDLVELWRDELFDAIPRAIFFMDKGCTVSIFGMENGTVYNRDAETSNAKSSKVFKTPAGSVGICSATANVLIDNMRDGFDLYVPCRAAPLRSFKVRSTRQYVRGCEFGEGGKVVVCGSDHGKVYVFGVPGDEMIQELAHGNRGQMIQTVQTCTMKGSHLIVSGSSDGKFDIAVWKRAVRHRVKGTEKPNIIGALFVSHIVFAIIFAWMTQHTWLNIIRTHLSSTVALPGGFQTAASDTESRSMRNTQILENTIEITTRKPVRRSRPPTHPDGLNLPTVIAVRTSPGVNE